VTTESVSLPSADEKLTASVELESVIGEALAASNAKASKGNDCGDSHVSGVAIAAGMMLPLHMGVPLRDGESIDFVVCGEVDPTASNDAGVPLSCSSH
jgi:hypothetical protein